MIPQEKSGNFLRVDTGFQTGSPGSFRAAFCQTNPGSIHPRFASFGGSGSPDRHEFAKNRHYCFAKSPIRHPFGWIRHESGLEKTAFSTFWTGDHLMGWAEVG